jgi:uncharacterized lipoprotein YbaY/heat shock protein HslJ
MTAVRSCLQPPWSLPLLGMALLLGTASCSDSTNTGSGQSASAQTEDTATISGTISYRERIALSSMAEVEITLQDVSRQDVGATVLARQTITDPGQVPIRFEIEFRPHDIDPRMSYSLRATIHDGGRLAFTSDRHTPVLTRGAGRVANLTLVRVAQATDDRSAGGMQLEGMFRYMADAALFRDCRSGKSFPVAMEGAYIDLERAYLNSGIEAGAEALVRIRGRYMERPVMEGNRNEVNLILDLFKEILPDQQCAPTHHADLRNTYWKLVELASRNAVTPEGAREIHIILSGEDSRAHGHAGCNNFFGGFEIQDATLKFSALGSTMMACPQGMDTEQAFLGALADTTAYDISGQILSLYQGDRLLARFEAVYF